MPGKGSAMVGFIPRLCYPGRCGPGLTVSFVVVFSLTCCSSSEAAKLSHYLTSEDLAGRIVLDQNGQQIQLPTARDRHPELAKGSVPTYLAIPLYGREHLSGTIPKIDTGSQLGENPVGPLSFDSLVKANLDATLAKTRLAIVDTSTQNYLVDFLPRRSRSGLSLDKAGNVVSELSNLLTTGSNQLSKLTQGGTNELEKLLHISTKTSPLIPSLNLEAQVLNGEIVPAAVPEPATWVVFMGLIAGTTVMFSKLSFRRDVTGQGLPGDRMGRTRGKALSFNEGIAQSASTK
jgi:hypothetical protein